MQQRRNRGPRKERRWLISAGAMAMVLVLLPPGCAPVRQALNGNRAGAAVTQPPPDGPVFRSERFVVYRLDGHETPQGLAERFLGDAQQAWRIQEANSQVPYRKGQMIVIPLAERGRGGLAAGGYQLVPVLCYHRFAVRCGSRLCLPATVFEEQLQYLKQNGYHTIGPAELRDFLGFRRALPPKAVMITIDDGYRSAYEVAYPLLRQYGFRATFFIYTEFIGSTATALTWEMLAEMVGQGFDVASHTLSHCNLTAQKPGEADDAYLKRIEKEMAASKEQIDARLGYETLALAYPYGEYNAKVLEIMDRCGYELGFSVQRGSNPFFADPLTLKRHQMLFREMDEFISRLQTFEALSLR